MRRWRRRLAVVVAGVVAALAIALVATDLPGDAALYPAKPGTPIITVYVVSNGFHTGLAIPRSALVGEQSAAHEAALAAVTQRFALYDFLEFGWGEERFYRGTPNIAAFQWRSALRALFWENQTVVQVVGLSQPPSVVFAGATLIRIDLSAAGFGRLAARLDESFGRGPDGAPIEIAPGLYGPSLFYRAIGQTGIFNVCNNWIGRLLNAAGLADQPLLSTTAAGLFADLRFRSRVREVDRLSESTSGPPDPDQCYRGRDDGPGSSK